MCCNPDIFRYDIKSGKLLAEWSAGGAIAVYGPPLLGDPNVESTVDSYPEPGRVLRRLRIEDDLSSGQENLRRCHDHGSTRMS